MFAKTTRLLTALVALIIACSMAVPISAMLGILGPSKDVAPDAVIMQDHPRSLDYRWYDMFNVPFGEWWSERWTTYGIDEPLTDSYPYILRYHNYPPGNDTYMSNMRLDVEGRNMTELNMNSHPEFLPYLGTARGGNATIIWYLQYLTAAELEKFPPLQPWNDGWLVSLNGTVLLDQQAAASVLGVDTVGWNNFATWWADNNASVSAQYSQWLTNESRKDRLDIYPMYDSNFQLMNFVLSAERFADYVFLSYDTISWGMEALMARWLNEAFMPSEWYYEDMLMIASIGPDMADLDMMTAVAYAVQASEPVDSVGDPCWVWEGMKGDYVPSAPPEHPHSDFDAYLPYEYLERSPGSASYRMMKYYDYTPGAWNLSVNETMTFEWPSGQQLFKVQDPLNPTEALNYSDEMIVDYSEPMHTDMADFAPGAVFRDNLTKQITFIGPIDMWTWSKNQAAHQYLADEWDRLGILPYGMPYIEFKPAGYVDTFPAYLVVANIPDNPVIETPVNFSVVVADNIGGTFTDYNGTVHFSSDRPSEVDLPADYTFVPEDEGFHNFTGLTFHGLGSFTIMCEDVSDPNLTGSDSNIFVVGEAPRIDNFLVVVIGGGAGGACVAGESSSVLIFAMDQFDNLYTDYSGTVTFSTNATIGTYTLPIDYTFDPLIDGGIAVVDGLVFNVPGIYNLTVADTSNSSVRGTAEDVVVLEGVQQHIDYRIYDMFEQRWGDWWWWRLATYKTDIILNNKPHEYTMVYNPDTRNLQGIIYAPYRFNTSATGVQTVNVHHPEFMPVLGTPDVPGAQVDMHLWWEYLDNESWDGYWIPTWKSNPNWQSAYDALMPASGMGGQFADGYYLGVVYTATMNREAALEWLGMPLAASPVDWWNSGNNDSYMQAWRDWILYEGNVRLDIWPAYEWPYVDIGTMMDLVEESNGDVTLRIGHFSWGFEALITRWLNETGICTHEPYMEDFNLSARYENSYADVYFDAVAQYNLHAVKANGTVDGAAWVWEPQKMDYVEYYGLTRTSEFNPWANMYYESWNAGDGYFGDPLGVPYDFTPTYFNLTDNQTLTIQLPTHNNVIGYVGQGLPTGRTYGAIYELKMGNPSMYENITIHGTMWLGWYMTGTGPGAPDLSSMYDNYTKTLYMVGPLNFDNYHHENGLLYHSAPWIEFDVSNGTPADFEPVAVAGPDQLVMAGELVVLNGTWSYDDNGIVNWTWTIDLGGSTVTLYGPIVTYTFSSEGVYNVTLTVRDTLGQTNSDTLQVTVSGVIPEFGSLFLPAIGIAILVAAIGGLRRRRD